MQHTDNVIKIKFSYDSIKEKIYPIFFSDVIDFQEFIESIAELSEISIILPYQINKPF